MESVQSLPRPSSLLDLASVGVGQTRPVRFNGRMDPVDRLIIDEWASLRAPCPARLLVIDAPALVEPARGLADGVFIWCDDVRDMNRIPGGLRASALDAEGLAGADAVWMRLPKSLAALDQIAGLVAVHADPGVRLVAGGRVKHMTRSQNEVLARHFGKVHASLGRQKSRVLHASGPLPGPMPGVERRHDDDTDIEVLAFPGTFAGAGIDIGTRLLVPHLADVTQGRVHDLGCGNGTIATLLACDPARQVSASDVSACAVASTRATAEANGVHIAVRQAAGLAHLANHSLDAIVTNPPFHVGTTKESAPTLEMFADAARVLRPSGEFWCVFNSHLPWRARLRELVGPTRVIDQNRNFTVVMSTNR